MEDDAKRRALLGDELFETEQAAQRAVREELCRRRAAGLPIVRYEAATGRVYLEHPDGSVEYVRERTPTEVPDGTDEDDCD